MRHHTQPSTASGIVMRWLCSCALGLHLVQVHRLCDHMGALCVLGCFGVAELLDYLPKHVSTTIEHDVHARTTVHRDTVWTNFKSIYVYIERERAITKNVSIFGRFSMAGAPSEVAALSDQLHLLAMLATVPTRLRSRGWSQC